MAASQEKRLRRYARKPDRSQRGRHSDGTWLRQPTALSAQLLDTCSHPGTDSLSTARGVGYVTDLLRYHWLLHSAYCRYLFVVVCSSALLAAHRVLCKRDTADSYVIINRLHYVSSPQAPPAPDQQPTLPPTHTTGSESHDSGCSKDV